MEHYTRLAYRRCGSVGLTVAAILLLSAFACSTVRAAPTHPFHESLSHQGAFNRPCGTATDPEGDLYVASDNEDQVSVYGPTGTLITRFTPSANATPCSLAVDSGGDVYVDSFEPLGNSNAVVKYKPSAYPPTGATTYAPDTAVNGTGVLVAKGATAVAVDPANQRAYVVQSALNEKQAFNRPTAAQCSTATKFTITYAPTGQTTGELECTSTAGKPTTAEFVTALEGILGAGNVGVAGASTAKTIEFKGALAGTNIPAEALEIKKGAGSEVGTVISKSTTSVEGAASRVSSFEPDGTLVDGTIGEGLVGGANYYGVDVYGTNGDVYVTDKAHDEAYVLNAAGTQVLAAITGSGGEGEGPFEAMKDPLLAVDQSDGHVFVSDIPGHGVVDEFDASGAFVSQLGPSFGSGLAFAEAEPSDIAVDRGSSSPNSGEVYVTSGNGAGGSVYAFGALSYAPPPEAITEPPATAVTQTTAVLHGKVNPRGVATESCEFLWGPAAGDYSEGSAACSPDPGSASERISVTAEATGLTPHATVHYVVRITTAGGTVEGADENFVASASPVATTEAATEVEEEAATLNASVNPEGGTATDCRFEYGRTESYSQTQPCQPDPGSASVATPVSAHIAGLEPRVGYDYRVVITTDGGTAVGANRTFITSAVPTILEEGAAERTKSSATLTASIDPNGLSTTFHFEYVPLSVFEESGFSAPTTIVMPESAPIGEGHGAVAVEEAISGLAEETAYEFRVVATSAAESVDGQEESFFTCDSSYSSGLPDCRAYELVSPAEKGPLGTVGEQINNVTPFQPWYQVAPGGESVFYEMSPGLPSATVGGEVLYSASRSSSGWSSDQLSPPSLVPPNRTVNNLPSAYLYTPGDLDCSIVASSQPLTTDSPQRVVEEGGKNLYRRNPDGSYTLLTDLTPTNPATESESILAAGVSPYQIVGASQNCSRVVFTSKYRYEGQSVGTEKELYEWSEATTPHIRHVAFVPNGSGEEAVVGSVGDGSKNFWNAVSSDASRVFFSTGNSGNKKLYVRLDGMETLLVSASETAVPDTSATFQDASRDGSRVFFTANAGLTAVSNSIGTDLYECHIVDSADEHTCELTDLSVDANPADTDGAAVVGVLGASDDGSHVYFAAKGQLVRGQGPSYQQNQSSGTYGIFLDDEGDLSYVGRAKEADTEVLIENSTTPQAPWVSRVTPDGNRLLFLSSADVTGYESGGAREAYLFSAPRDETTCISCRADGQPSVGDATTRPLASGSASGAGAASQNVNPLNPPVILTMDGSRVFFQMPDVLAPGAVSGAFNLYEWDHGTISLLATEARGAVGSSGLEYVGASEDGSDVFIASAARLVPQDTDGRKDLYDLHAPRSAGEGVGFPAAAPPSKPCEALVEGACQGQGGTPGATTGQATSGFAGPGNASPPSKKKHHKKKHHKKKHHKKKHVKRKAKHRKRKKAGRGRSTATGPTNGGQK